MFAFPRVTFVCLLISTPCFSFLVFLPSGLYSCLCLSLYYCLPCSRSVSQILETSRDCTLAYPLCKSREKKKCLLSAPQLLKVYMVSMHNVVENPKKRKVGELLSVIYFNSCSKMEDDVKTEQLKNMR